MPRSRTVLALIASIGLHAAALAALSCWLGPSHASIAFEGDGSVDVMLEALPPQVTAAAPAALSQPVQPPIEPPQPQPPAPEPPPKMIETPVPLAPAAAEKRSKFRPVMIDGRPGRVKVTVPYTFGLQ